MFEEKIVRDKKFIRHDLQGKVEKIGFLLSTEG